MGIFAYRINQTFETLDTTFMRRLRVNMVELLLLVPLVTALLCGISAASGRYTCSAWPAP